MKLRKLMTLFLVLVMLLSLAACDEKPSAEENGQSSSDDQKTSALPSMNTNVTIEETVVVDKDGVKITAKNLSFSEEAALVDIFIENNTGFELTVESSGVNAINGMMTTCGYLSCELLDGATANETLEFDFKTPTLLGITEIAEFELNFELWIDYEDRYDHVIWGGQVKTSAYETHDYSTDNYRTAITNPAVLEKFEYELLHMCEETDYDVDGVKILSAAFVVADAYDDRETGILLEIENNSDQPVNLYADNGIVNGISANCNVRSGLIMPHKTRVAGFPLYKNDINETSLEAMGIDGIGEVTFFIEHQDYKDDELTEPVALTLRNPQFDTSYDATGTELYNQNGIRIVKKALLDKHPDYDESDIFAYLLVENRTDSPITIEILEDSVTVNGTLYSKSQKLIRTQPGQNYVDCISLYEPDLKEIGINSIEEIKEISFQCTIDYQKTSITITFP